jgi:signal transduction histidine kinase/CheY-like chemotaxis protein/HPt (histidine-containing phosphotransfer) domain-containing protein
VRKTSFIGSVKGKIIVAAILACFALFMAWVTSKDAFSAVLNAFENVSAPNEKLRIVNDLSHRVTRLDQEQKARLLNNSARYYNFLNETKKLSLEIDTLKHLYTGEPAQIKRLNTLKKLLQDRDRLFGNYLKVREGLVNNKSFSVQMRALNAMVNKSAKQADSTVTTTEKKTSTTTIYPEGQSTVKEQNRGFLNKLFGRKKPQNKDSDENKSYRVVDEELHIKHDTLAKAMQDSLLQGLGQTMQNMEKIQRLKSALFVNREAVLTKSSANVTRQIITILKKVETEVVAQTVLNNKIAKSVVNNSVKRISLIMLAFLILTILLVYFILTDISRINRYRKELEMAKDEAEYHALAKHRFLSNMSHEIRTPLQSIIGYAEMVKQQERPQKNDIEAIYRSSAHLMQIVNEVLDYNRIISGKITFMNQVFNIRALIDEVISVMSPGAEKKDLVLRADYDNTVWIFVEGDPFRLKQILFNLLGNAIKFTYGGEIILTVKEKPVNNNIHYSFDVTDTGVGLSPDEIDLIFNEFEQAGDEKLSQTGTGLGLPITKELIERQGGSIIVKSEPGKGSSFIFELTFEKPNQPINIARQAPALASNPFDDKVWIVDDDPFILELCSRIFDNNKIDYRCFGSPYEVLSTPWDDNVKCLLLDMRMPGMNGTELCRLLRKQITGDIKIYALTAQAMPDERKSVIEQGFDGLLMKPFRENELIAIIKNGGQNLNDNDKPEFDVNAVEKMTFGDPEQTAKIFARFAEDSVNDISELKVSVNENQVDTVLLLTHRIAGRTAQVGARELAKSFRLAEIELDRDNELTENRISNILRLTDELNDLVTATDLYFHKETAI